MTIKKILFERIEYLIPGDVIQVGPSCNIENYHVKFYFTSHKQVSVLYQREDGSFKTQALRNIKEVRYSYLNIVTLLFVIFLLITPFKIVFFD